MAPAEDLTCTRATQMAVAVSAAAAEISDLSRALVAPAPHRGHGGLVEDAQAIVDHANRLLLLAVAAERSQGATWREIGDATGCGIQEADARFADEVRVLEQAVIEHWLDTAAGGCSTTAALPVADPIGTARRLDAWVEPQGLNVVSRGLQYLSDGDHAWMISAAYQLLAQLRAAGTDDSRIRELEYGYLHRCVESDERMLDNPAFSRGRETRIRENLDKTRARIAELDEARASGLVA